MNQDGTCSSFQACCPDRGKKRAVGQSCQDAVSGRQAVAQHLPMQFGFELSQLVCEDADLAIKIEKRPLKPLESIE
jgi:hypothetical protein